jgi:hypothetical protein
VRNVAMYDKLKNLEKLLRGTLENCNLLPEVRKNIL